MKELEELEQKVFSASRCYQDSTAFRCALMSVKRRDPEYYKELLEIEGCECGVFD